MNVLGVRRIVELARKLKNLEVSLIYSMCGIVNFFIIRVYYCILGVDVVESVQLMVSKVVKFPFTPDGLWGK